MLQNVQISSAKIRIISETQKKMAGKSEKRMELFGS
jgi:hypothetical protein